MQIMCLISCFALSMFWEDKMKYGVISKPKVNELINSVSIYEYTHIVMYTLLGEHLMSYCFSIYRNWELSKIGVPNKYGI